MAYKQFDIEGIGPLTIYKRRGTRSLRLSISREGAIKVSIPAWAPYQTGLKYAESKRLWLQKQLSERQTVPLSNGQAIGKQHHLYFEAAMQEITRTRLLDFKIIVRYPRDLTPTDSRVQQAAEKACVRALRREAEELLPARLRALAARHGFTYRSFGVKQLKGRWGSCDQQRHITINLFIMQLPWQLIDYVLLHELTHTEQLHHGANFWQRFTEVLPEARQLQKTIRQYQPTVQLTAAEPVVS